MDVWTVAWADPMFALFAVGGTLVSMGTFFVVAGLLTIYAWRDPPALRIYRIQRRRATNVAAKVKRGILMWLANNSILFVLVAFAWPLVQFSAVHAGPLPAWWVIALQLLLFIYVDDFLYYFMHRAMHRSPFMWRRVHAWHHRTKTPWAVGAHDMHPVEFIATASLMLALPVLIGAHVAVIWMWIAIRQIEAAEGHCGYDFPIALNRLIPFSGGAAHHDFHHSQVKGNFAGFMPHVDRWLGTLVRNYEEYRARRRS
ncbi:MAG: 4-alpha-methyl-delta7-sterol-4alpha-methyl oxidase [Bradymonadia bacterium]|jgi:4-alpha-methyl-delta7-sterol-4alpha-methyl oxidase